MGKILKEYYGEIIGENYGTRYYKRKLESLPSYKNYLENKITNYGLINLKIVEGDESLRVVWGLGDLVSKGVVIGIKLSAITDEEQKLGVKEVEIHLEEGYIVKEKLGLGNIKSIDEKKYGEGVNIYKDGYTKLSGYRLVEVYRKLILIEDNCEYSKRVLSELYQKELNYMDAIKSIDWSNSEYFKDDDGDELSVNINIKDLTVVLKVGGGINIKLYPKILYQVNYILLNILEVKEQVRHILESGHLISVISDEEVRGMSLYKLGGDIKPQEVEILKEYYTKEDIEHLGGVLRGIKQNKELKKGYESKLQEGVLEYYKGKGEELRYIKSYIKSLISGKGKREQKLNAIKLVTLGYIKGSELYKEDYYKIEGLKHKEELNLTSKFRILVEIDDVIGEELSKEKRVKEFIDKQLVRGKYKEKGYKYEEREIEGYLIPERYKYEYYDEYIQGIKRGGEGIQEILKRKTYGITKGEEKEGHEKILKNYREGRVILKVREYKKDVI